MPPISRFVFRANHQGVNWHRPRARGSVEKRFPSWDNVLFHCGMRLPAVNDLQLTGGDARATTDSIAG